MLSWDINWVAVLVAVITFQALGFLWYGLLFSKMWLAGMGKTREDISGGAGAAMVTGIISSAIAAVALALLLTLGDEPDLELGITLGAIAGVGFIASSMVTSAAYEEKNPTVLWLGIGYQLAGMIVMGAILGGWQ
jgi:hypothetical protein